MATKIVTKNSSTAASVPTAAQLVQGELAVNVADKRLYTEDNAGAIVELGTNPSTLTVTGEITANGGIALGDNDKATFGAGDDLQIFHDGSASYVKDVGTGDLILQGTNLQLRSASSKRVLQGIEAGATKIFYDNSEKLATTATGIDVTGNASFADNGKATFGAGDDLQIYHDGSHSQIKDAGTGNLYIKATSGVLIQDNDTGTNRITTSAAGPVYVYHAGALKLATTNTGIDVTGNVVADGLTVDNITIDGSAITANATNLIVSSGTSAGDKLDLKAGDDIRLYVDGQNTSKLGATFESNGDVSFYEDTGTTAKMVWDSSAESLGLGTSSPSETLAVESASNNAILLNSPANRYNAVGFQSAGVDKWWMGRADTDIIAGDAFFIGADAGNATDAGGTSAKLVMDSSGNVGIGGAPAVVTHGPHLDLVGNRGTLTVGTGYFEDNGNTNFIGGARSLAFGAGGSGERMRIDSSGNLLVGTTDSTLFNNTSGGGANILSDGLTIIARQTATTVDTVFIVNDTGAGGSLQEFRKDGATVGSIGSINGDLNIGTGDAALRFNDSSNRIEPFNVTTNANTNGTVDLGVAGASFKDLYLSGSAFIDTQLRAGNGSAASPSMSFSGDSDSGLFRATTNVLGFSTTGSERMRIDSSGNLLVGTTDTSLAANGAGGVEGVMVAPDHIQMARSSNAGLFINRMDSDGTVAEFRKDGTTVGSIGVTGSATSYNTSSDQRLKENIADADDAGSKIDAIQVRKYDWKADGSHQDYGMIAQELQAVAPEAVSGDADSEEMMGVDYSKLVPMLIKEIQSLRNRVAQLEEGI